MILFATDTYPENPDSIFRLPAIRDVIQGYGHKVVELFEPIIPVAGAHEIRRTNAHKKYFSKRDLRDVSGKFLSYMNDNLKFGDTLVLGTLDCVSLFLFPDTIRRIRNNWIKVVCFFGDDEFMLNRHAHWVERFDLCVAYVKWCVDYYNNIVPGSTYYMPQGCFFKDEYQESEKIGDVVFVGSSFSDPDGERPTCLKKLIKNDVDVTIYGNGWDTMHGGFFQKNWKGYLPPANVVDTIKKYRISLAFLGDHLTGAPHMNASIWTAAAAGVACVATHYEPLYTDYKLNYGTNIHTVRDGSELLFTIDFSLSKDIPGQDWAKNSGRNLFDYVKENFNLVNLYKDFFKHLEGL